MAVEARKHQSLIFCVDPAHRQSYREDLVGAIGHPSAVRQTRSAAANALRAKLSAPSTTNRLIAHILCDQRVRLQVTRFGAGVTPHPRSSSRRANTMSARFEHTPPHHETSASSSQGCSSVQFGHSGSEAGADFDRALWDCSAKTRKTRPSSSSARSTSRPTTVTPRNCARSSRSPGSTVTQGSSMNST